MTNSTYRRFVYLVDKRKPSANGNPLHRVHVWEVTPDDCRPIGYAKGFSYNEARRAATALVTNTAGLKFGELFKVSELQEPN